MATSVNILRTSAMQKEGDLIRAAHSAGKRTVVISERKFKISKQVKTRKVVLGPPLKFDEQYTVEVTDAWLVAKPANGDLVPMYSVALKYGTNGIAAGK
jgi:hypothetical protein